MPLLIADPRLVRRVVRRERRIGGMGVGMDVPHGHCCIVERAPLLRVVTEDEIGRKAAQLPARIILIARPDDDADDETGERHRRLVWRRAFHGHVHLHLEGRARDGTLTEALARARIHAIGQTEFDEIRSVLHDERLLFSTRDDREAYIEFAAFYLELVYFDPQSLPKYFPTIRDEAHIDAVLGLDVDGDAILEASRPEGARDPVSRRVVASTYAPPRLAPPRLRTTPSSRRLSKSEHEELVSAAKRKGNVVRSMLMRLAADDASEKARASEDVAELARRLSMALAAKDATDPAPTSDAWSEVILALAEAAARSDFRALEARILHDLQKACVDVERARRAVDPITWLTSLFRRPIVRPLPMTNVVRAARHLQHAFDTSHRTSLTKPQRAALEEVFQAAIHRARSNVRRAFKPVLESTLDEVGLVPRNIPERVAREKLCEELLDVVHQRGTLGISHLRDAISRSSLKLPNLTPGALVSGDPILRADALLSERLDGIYRRGEIYLRGLQKVSSVAFGTVPGRLFTLHLALPLLLSFVLLEGLQHIVHPIARKLGHHHVHILGTVPFLALAVFFYGNIHSEAVRGASRVFFRGIGAVLHAVVIGVPRFILRSKPVRALLSNRITSVTLRSLLLLAPAYWVARRFGHLAPHTSLAIAAAAYVVIAMVQGTRAGLIVEEIVTDMVARRLRVLSRHVLPGLFAFISDSFKGLVEQLDRGIYTVDEWLTFKQGQSTLSLIAKGVLGTIWFFATYLLRIYVNVLVEPQINPIKHFPVVTVSHKIILPLSPTLLEAFRTPLSPLGPVVANTIAGSTVFLLPGMFGFLVWELKANWNLYAQNRSRLLETVRVGHHGETMNALLVRGFHAGTVPKLFAKVRDAVSRGKLKANSYRAKLHEVEHAVFEFVERELVGLLREAKRWTAGDLEVVGVPLASNRIRIGIACPDLEIGKGEAGASHDALTAWIHFEEQSGLLVANVAFLGFLELLPADQLALFETALAGLYKRAGVDLVREQIEACIAPESAYDIADEGLIVWPGSGYRTEVVYPLAPTARGTIEAKTIRGEPPETAPKALDANALLFSKQRIEWASWILAFEPSESAHRVLGGPALINTARRTSKPAPSG